MPNPSELTRETETDSDSDSSSAFSDSSSAFGSTLDSEVTAAAARRHTPAEETEKFKEIVRRAEEMKKGVVSAMKICEPQLHAMAEIASDLVGDPFYAILTEVGELHRKKGADYGTNEDPLANLRASADFGIPPWVGAVLRANDKIRRIKSFILKGRLENESLEDSLIDCANYFVLALQLYRETKTTTKGE